MSHGNFRPEDPFTMQPSLIAAVRSRTGTQTRCLSISIKRRCFKSRLVEAVVLEGAAKVAPAVVLEDVRPAAER